MDEWHPKTIQRRVQARQHGTGARGGTCNAGSAQRERVAAKWPLTWSDRAARRGNKQMLLPKEVRRKGKVG